LRLKPDNFADLDNVTDFSRRFLSSLLCLCLQEASCINQDACSDGCDQHHRNEDNERPDAHLTSVEVRNKPKQLFSIIFKKSS
jgi:hypothetical protein